MKTMLLVGVVSTMMLCNANAAKMGDRADTVAGVVKLTKTLMIYPPKAPIIIVRKLVETIVKVLW